MIEEHWRRCFDDLGGSPPPPCVFEDLQARYCEPGRAYHTRQHLDECFAWFGQARSMMHAPGRIAFALFYHDAIYDTRAADNEARSAALACDVLSEYARANDGDADAVAALILATKHDAVPGGGDAQVLVDIDLSILGAAVPRFDEYERQVRREYHWVEAEAFRTGRARILRQFLDRPAIYNTAFFRARLEAAARDNLARSLRALTG
jgi:predicted metal-dependent HD superfamily phosphohydrolase